MKTEAEIKERMIICKERAEWFANEIIEERMQKEKETVKERKSVRLITISLLQVEQQKFENYEHMLKWVLGE